MICLQEPCCFLRYLLMHEMVSVLLWLLKVKILFHPVGSVGGTIYWTLLAFLGCSSCCSSTTSFAALR